MLGEWMQREIEEQPALLADRANSYFSELLALIGDCRPELILLVARGSSDHAALYGRYLIEVHLGIPAVLAAPSVLTRYHRSIRYPTCLAIGISQSGSAPDVAEVLSDLRAQGQRTLAITNTAGSRITDAADAALLLGIGEERSVAATKTYTASLLALHELVRALGASLPPPPMLSHTWSECVCMAAHAHAPIVIGSAPVFTLGRGYGFSTANEAALKLMECALIPAKAYSSADFEHGPKALAGGGAAIVAFEPISKALRNQGAEVVEPPRPEVSEEMAPIWQAIYAQWLALCCARLKGEDPDRPQFLKKVTRTL